MSVATIYSNAASTVFVHGHNDILQPNLGNGTIPVEVFVQFV